MPSYTLYIICRGVHLLVKLQAGGTIKQTTKMKSLTGISQRFDKCTKVTLQSNCFWGTSPDDYFCLDIWLWYHYDKKPRKFKSILIWRSSRMTNGNKNLLILHYLLGKFSKFSNAQKKVFHSFCFQLCSTANAKFSLYFWLCEINSIKIWAMSLISKFTCFRTDSLCLIYFDVIIHRGPKESLS